MPRRYKFTTIELLIPQLTVWPKRVLLWMGRLLSGESCNCLAVSLFFLFCSSLGSCSVRGAFFLCFWVLFCFLCLWLLCVCFWELLLWLVFSFVFVCFLLIKGAVFKKKKRKKKKKRYILSNNIYLPYNVFMMVYCLKVEHPNDQL